MNRSMRNPLRAIMQVVCAAVPLYAISISQAYAYPEYEQFVEKNSHRTANCAMCHVNENGPVGDGIGQVGKLNEEEMKRLNIARVAMQPGQNVDSPILNKFGNRIMSTVGKIKFLELRSDPAKLAPLLGNTSDLDGDGIPDSQEFLDGTDPLNKFHGDPGKLFWINLHRNKLHIVLAAIAIISINFGLLNLVKAMNLKDQLSKKKVEA